MKKILFIAAVALAAAACSKTYSVGNDTQKAVGFATWAETMTKAYAGTWTEDVDAFKVYGTKKVGTNPAEDVFTGEEVTYKGGTTWSYSPLKFWDLTASNYTFYAFLPASKMASGTTAGIFESTAVSFANPTTNTEDILVASKEVRTRATGNSFMSTDAVELHFNHMASLVDFKVKKAESVGADAVITITSATLTGVYDEGTLNVTGYDGTTNKPTYSAFGWTPTTSTKTYTSTATPCVAEAVTTYDASGYASSTTSNPYGNIFTSYVLMPQDLTKGQKLNLEYTIADTQATANYTAEVNLEEFVKASATYSNPDNTFNNGDAITGWMPGVHYTYYVTISAKAITFTASVNPWDISTSTGYHYLLD